MRCETHGGWLLAAGRRSFASVHNKGGYPIGRIPALPMCHRLLCLRVVLWPVATDGVVTPGSRPHHTERQHCRYWNAPVMQFPDYLRRHCQLAHRQMVIHYYWLIDLESRAAPGHSDQAALVYRDLLQRLAWLEGRPGR